MTTIPIEHMNMPTIVIDVSRYRHKHENFYESKLSHLIVSIYAAKINIFQKSQSIHEKVTCLISNPSNPVQFLHQSGSTGI